MLICRGTNSKLMEALHVALKSCKTGPGRLDSGFSGRPGYFHLGHTDGGREWKPRSRSAWPICWWATPKPRRGLEVVSWALSSHSFEKKGRAGPVTGCNLPPKVDACPYSRMDRVRVQSRPDLSFDFPEIRRAGLYRDSGRIDTPPRLEARSTLPRLAAAGRYDDANIKAGIVDSRWAS